MAQQSEKDKAENVKRPKWQDRVEKVATIYFAFCRRTAVTITRAKRRKKNRK